MNIEKGQIWKCQTVSRDWLYYTVVGVIEPYVKIEPFDDNIEYNSESFMENMEEFENGTYILVSGLQLKLLKVEMIK